MYENQFTILPVANGFIVTLPYQVKKEPSVDIRSMMREIKEVMKPEDDILNKIKNDALYEEKELMEDFGFNKMRNMHVFKTWIEVVQFLDTHTDKSFI